MTESTQILGVTQLDDENPWPGLDSFDEGAHGFFYGRNEEVVTLLRNVMDAPVTVLYGRSGLGKTSLLRAGVFPLLRKQRHLPIYMRFDMTPESPSIVEQMYERVFSAIAAVPDAMPRLESESLWEYLHRADFELWDLKNFPLTPTLVIDQFEEIFTLGARMTDDVDSFRNALGDLIENRIPSDLAKLADVDGTVATRLSLRARNYKILVSLREDFLPELDGWCNLIPALGRSRIRLLPLRGSEALEAVSRNAREMT